MIDNSDSNELQSLTISTLCHLSIRNHLLHQRDSRIQN